MAGRMTMARRTPEAAVLRDHLVLQIRIICTGERLGLAVDYSSGTKTRYIPGTQHLLLADVEEEKKKRHKSAPFSPFGTSPARRELLPAEEINPLKTKTGVSQSFEQIFSVSRNVPTKRVYIISFFFNIS